MIALPCYAQCYSPTAFSGAKRCILWTWLPLRDWKSFNAARAQLSKVFENGAKDSQVLVSSCEELAAPGHI